MRIEYAPNGNVIRKPLIVVEGFDAGKIIKPESQFGLASIENFITNVSDDNFLLNGVLTQTQLDALLEGDNQEYDLIYVDYLDGTDDIERNAKLVEDVINYVNTNKAAVGGVMQANVVLGISMGGLCARLALKNMETASQNHQTRLFITWDTPHQGSNMPQGFQHLVRHASDIYISTGLTAGVLDMRIPLLMNGLQPRRVFKLADEPASKQMLINRVAPDNSIDNTTHDDWQADLSTLGHPEGFTGGFAFDRIAVSNGSECALTQGFNPGDNLIHLQGDAMNVGMLSDIIGRLGMPLVGAVLNQPSIAFYGGMPGRNKFKVTLNIHSKALNTGNQVYQFKIEYTKQLFNLITINTVLTDRSYNSNANTLPYDYYAGGNINIGEHGIEPEELSNWLYRYNIEASNKPTFCFVPVPSALDIGEGNVTLTHSDYLTPYRGAVPPTGTKSSPFDAFITAFNGSPDNEKHVLIERRNGDWVAAWMQNNQILPFNCAGSCGGLEIIGGTSFCSDANYSVSGLPANATVTWQATPSNIVNIACSTSTPVTCQQATVSRIADGLITLQATISGGCNIPSLTLENITVGTPKFTYSGADAFILNGQRFDYASNGPGNSFSVCPSENLIFNPYLPAGYSPPGVTGYQWTITGSYSAVGPLNQESLFVTSASSHPNTFSFTYRYQNACGWSPTYNGQVGTMDCDEGEEPYRPVLLDFDFSLYPNPAKNVTNISISGLSNNFDVRLFDVITSTMVKQIRGKKGQTQLTIPLGGLKPGFYIVQVSSAGALKAKQLNIQ